MSERQPIAVGFDAAIVRAGWAYASLGGYVHDAGWIDVTGRPRGALKEEVRLLLNILSARFDPMKSVVGLERGFLGKNARIHEELAEVRGELKNLCESYGFRVEYVHHARWRRSIGFPRMGANRKDLKRDAIAKARLLAPTIPITNDDVADATCIACHMAAMEKRRLQIAEAERRRA